MLPHEYDPASEVPKSSAEIDDPFLPGDRGSWTTAVFVPRLRRLFSFSSLANVAVVSLLPVGLSLFFVMELLPAATRCRLPVTGSAIGSMRTIHSAQTHFFAEGMRPIDGVAQYGTLAELASQTPPFIDEALASGEKSGYIFELEVFEGTAPAFVAHAWPKLPSLPPIRFRLDETGIIRTTDDGSVPTETSGDIMEPKPRTMSDYLVPFALLVGVLASVTGWFWALGSFLGVEFGYLVFGWLASLPPAFMILIVLAALWT